LNFATFFGGEDRVWEKNDKNKCEKYDLKFKKVFKVLKLSIIKLFFTLFFYILGNNVGWRFLYNDLR